MITLSTVLVDTRWKDSRKTQLSTSTTAWLLNLVIVVLQSRCTAVRFRFNWVKQTSAMRQVNYFKSMPLKHLDTWYQEPINSGSLRRWLDSVTDEKLSLRTFSSSRLQTLGRSRELQCGCRASVSSVIQRRQRDTHRGMTGTVRGIKRGSLPTSADWICLSWQLQRRLPQSTHQAALAPQHMPFIVIMRWSLYTALEYIVIKTLNYLPRILNREVFPC